jgi:hypothetical protein
MWQSKPLHIDSLPQTTALNGTLDVYVWREKDDAIRGTPIQRPGVAPLRVGDGYRIEANLDRPAFVYLVSIDASGLVHIFYPWIPEQQQKRPAKETPVAKVVSPPEEEARGWPITTGGAGMTTILFLARQTPLPEEIDLAALFGREDPPPLSESNPVAFFVQGNLASRKEAADGGTRSSDFTQPKPISDPLLQFHSRLAQRLRPHFDLIRAVSYADLGN